ncbi:hypothetical protein [Shewanella septentrionalis]|uniref:Uncharacterized protein n=1 Tax=Shewanella septentrionalis TaxID=2952223 RepID=A0A9X3AW99_9GAMM|nr:hypothetical protein [Shewanella septentrionalis]MCT7948061.1 hypothetical protein [Shewanella septentrionalis]
MSEFSKELLVTAEFCQSQDIDVFAKHVPMDWVAEAVQQTGRAHHFEPVVSLQSKLFGWF